MKITHVLFLILTTPLVAGCSGNSVARSPSATFSGKYPIHVVCTTGMVADLVKHIGGEEVRVTQLMRAGVDPHLYKASPGDITSLNEADIVFYSGKHLEGKMADVLENLNRSKRSVAVTDGIKDAD